MKLIEESVKKEWDSIKQVYSEAPFSNELFSFIELLTNDFEQVYNANEEDIIGMLNTWRRHSEPIFKTEYSVEIFVEAILLLVGYWEHGSFLMAKCLTGFERAMVASVIEDRMAMAEKSQRRNQ